MNSKFVIRIEFINSEDISWDFTFVLETRVVEECWRIGFVVENLLQTISLGYIIVFLKISDLRGDSYEF